MQKRLQGAQGRELCVRDKGCLKCERSGSSSKSEILRVTEN